MDTAVAERYRRIETTARRVWQSLRDETARLGLGSVEISALDAARFYLEPDPTGGEPALAGDWRNARGHRRGTLVFHADGSFYVEHDVVQPHPRRPGWFVEAVHAWGRDDLIRVEARLLPMPE